MKKDLFKALPSEITFNILLRLPVRSIASSKCVCKSWLNLLSTDDFVDSHLSKPVPSLAFSILKRLERETSLYQVFEFEDDVESHDFRSNQVTKFSFPHKATIAGSANGLLLLQPVGSRVDDVVYIVNPVTREYVVVAGPNDELLSKKRPRSRAHGFGASRISRQHKVVRINEKFECYVYTLETGSWRRVAVEPAHSSLCFLDICCSVFVGGNLYWTVWFCASPTLVACFDLETECFSSFDAPASRGRLSVMKDCLCFCECDEDEIVLWLMKEKSWIKEYVIKRPVCDKRDYRPWPINVFKNGDMLMLCNNDEFVLFYNSNETKAIQEIAGILGPEESIFSMNLTMEKRGISGGYTKRVNVGLELVMEPSLLSLDKPTSVLDSCSSYELLLRALKHEALEGVIICLAVHQPSYSLLNMSDDLILLAKGGLTAYHGAVRDVKITL